MDFASSPQFSVTGKKRPPSALWLVDKPVGVTSASLVDDFRRAASGNFTLKVSHGGVLDPFAEGLVVLLVGAANRLFDALHDVPKTYVARVVWGRETDTGDAGGRLISEGDPSLISEAQLVDQLRQSAGPIDQVPPNTSNKRVDGERAYVRAHRGEAFELPPSRVVLHRARWLRHALPAWSEVELEVSAGFYVRSFARDLGRALGVGAHLDQLRRIAIGSYVPPVQPRRLTGREVLPWLPSRDLTDAQWGAVRANEVLPGVNEGERLFHQGSLVALRRGGRFVMLPGGL